MTRCSVMFVSLAILLWMDRSFGESFQTPTDAPRGKWHIHVTMHVFSGRSDPTWQIPEYYPSYKVILRNMGSIPSKPIPNKLGYKGFSLIHVAPGKLFNSGGAFNQTVTSFPDWELYLLNTADGVENGVQQHAKQTILNQQPFYPPKERRRRSSPDDLLYQKQWWNRDSQPKYNNEYFNPFEMPTTTQDPLQGLSNVNIAKLARAFGLKSGLYRNITTTPIPLGPTRYEPAKWNRNALLMKSNNCYNYANNEQTDTMAQPGRASECLFSITHPRGKDIEKSAVCDGLRELNAPDARKLPAHHLNLVALVFWPPAHVDDTWDFHWYRLDNNDRWSHKPGQTPATNVDQRDHAITDPRYADRGPYTEFVSFMETSPDMVNVL